MSNNRGIPTFYNGIQFRSRLESRWAAFFDSLGWRWQYEPFDLDGWIPDFILQGKTENTLVEIKPITFQSEPTEVMERLIRYAKKQEILLVGCTILDEYGNLKLGWHTDAEDEDQASFWEDASFMAIPQENKDSISVFDWCSTNQSYHGRMTGWYDGYIPMESEGVKEITDKWNHAGNLVQWRGIQSAENRR